MERRGAAQHRAGVALSAFRRAVPRHLPARGLQGVVVCVRQGPPSSWVSVGSPAKWAELSRRFRDDGRFLPVVPEESGTESRHTCAWMGLTCPGCAARRCPEPQQWRTWGRSPHLPAVRGWPQGRPGPGEGAEAPPETRVFAWPTWGGHAPRSGALADACVFTIHLQVVNPRWV